MDSKLKLPSRAVPTHTKTRSHLLRRAFVYLLLFAFAGFLQLTSLFRLPQSLLKPSVFINNDPADSFKDDVYPLRPPTPWDISTDFPFPRTLEYDVEEGTWLRLDVHPVSGDIVFDMIGDLYCIPASEAYSQRSNFRARARPILLGIPHDADPHFSPNGDLLVFRSDAELGVDNIWAVPYSDCSKMDLRPQSAPEDVKLARALRTKASDEDLLAMGVRETGERRANRLLREGRSQAVRVTNETFRYVTDARFHPSGKTVIATKWYTSSRSLGGGEGWEYNVSSSPKSISVGAGKRLVSRALPPGWDPANYNEQQIGPEQLIWLADDALLYSKNVQDQNAFEYSKDTHRGIYSIFSYNLTTQRTTTVVDSFPGGASRPELSRDKRTLAFVRRFRDYEALVLKDLQTGTLRHIWHGLTYDLSGISAPMGTYPSFAFTSDDTGIVIWSSGQIYIVPLTTNTLGEKVSNGEPSPIQFTAHIEKRLAETRKIDGELDLAAIETSQTVPVTAFKGLVVDDDGRKVVFEAAGETFVQAIGEKNPTKVPVLHDNGKTPYYSPSFVQGSKQVLVIHSKWDDRSFTSFEIADLESGQASEVTGIPMGRYLSPIVYAEHHTGKIAFVKTGGDGLTGDVVATAGVGLYVADIDISHATKKVSNIVFVPSEIETGDLLRMRFLAEGKKILVQQSQRSYIIDLESEKDIAGKPKHYTLAEGRTSTELALTITPSSSSLLNRFYQRKTSSASGYEVTNAAFVDSMHVYFTAGSNIDNSTQLWSKPGNSTKGLVRLSLDGGHDIAWSGNGKKLFWFLGPYLHSVEVSKLNECADAVKEDYLTFGIACVKELVQFRKIRVEHETDIARLRKEAKEAVLVSGQSEPEHVDMVVIVNATILTMETGDIEKDLIHDGVVSLRGGLIHSVGEVGSVKIPRGVTVIDAAGGYVLPGYIDGHAHWNGFSNPHPAKSWEMETFLAYGVTTLHNPSAAARDGYAERTRLERGHFVGPRIFQTGEVIYGAGIPEVHQDVADMAEARSALIRIKVEGGKFSTSYKNYNLPSRASRQKLLLAARNLTMLCVPEGGMNYDWDLTYIIDGMTTVEHSIPVPQLYDDVLKLFAWSGTGNTPTHIVNYGGTWGEQLVWATQDVPNDPKLRRFTRHNTLEGLTESTSRPATSYALFNTSASVAKMVSLGNGTFRTHIGAHGEPPLGVIYHAEMLYTAGGGYTKDKRTVAGLSSYQTLQAATSWAAQTFGLFNSVGSVTEGKLADLVVYPPGIDLLSESGLEKSRELLYVVRGGRIWDAEYMDEVWPVKRKRQTMPPLNPES